MRKQLRGNNTLAQTIGSTETHSMRASSTTECPSITHTGTPDLIGITIVVMLQDLICISLTLTGLDIIIHRQLIGIDREINSKTCLHTRGRNSKTFKHGRVFMLGEVRIGPRETSDEA